MTDLESRFDRAVELTVEDIPPGDAPGHVSAGRNAALGGGLLLAVGLLVLVCILSVAVGAKSIPLGHVFDALFALRPDAQRPPDHPVAAGAAHGRRPARRRRARPRRAP